MKIKKITSLLLILALFITEFGFLSLKNTSIAANENKDLSLETYSKDYYGRQLDEQAWKFYNAMVEMYSSGAFKRGLDYDLVAHGVVEESDLLKYATGTTKLLYDMTAARDAFQYDYPEVFWIDWSAISFRVTRNSEGKYFAFLGRGKRDDYFLPGFNTDNVDDAIAEYDQLMEKAVKAIREKAGHEDDEVNQNYQLAKAAHDWEMNQMSYKFEYEVENYNSPDQSYSNARTAYDCLKYGEGVCESYTRAYKAILDELEIPCIVSGGGYRVSDTQTENHSWNYVQIGEKWYGVDVTHDDDETPTKQSHRYFMVGTAELFDLRVESGIFSQSMFEFKFPELESTSLQDIVEEWDGELFKVKVLNSEYIEEGDHSGDDYGETLDNTFRVLVSYNDKNYEENAEDGKYMLARFATFDEDDNAWTYTNWGYITPDLYPMLDKGTLHDEELGDYVDFQLPQVQLVQFAVSDVGPKKNENGEYDINTLYYTGDPSFLRERTKEFINTTGNLYKAPPYITKATPIQSVKLGFESTFNVRLEYDDYFEVTDGTETGEIAITDVVKPDRTSRTDLINSAQISNVTYHLGGENSDDKAWVEFDFTPSTQFAANEVCYNITWKGVVGHTSQKSPIPATYGVGNKCDFCALSGQGIDCNVFAQPELMDTSDISTEKWQTKNENGEEVQLPDALKGADLNSLSHRLTLSTTTVSDEENEDMIDRVPELKDNSAKTQSYNIRMQLCKEQVVRTGDTVRIRLGFPEGTTYDDYISGRREFKVYHYNYDSLGNITGYNEIPVEVVPQGLILYVDSFSPFTIAGIEVPGDEQEQKAAEAKEKVLMLSSTEGGYLTCDDLRSEKIEMTNRDEVTIVIHPDEGKTVESVAIGTNVVPLADIHDVGDGTYTFKITKEQLLDGKTIVYAKFMSSLIVQEDIDDEHGNQVEQPEENDIVEIVDQNGSEYCDIHPSTATSVSSLIATKSVPGVKVEILDINGNVITDDNAIVGTGMKIRLTKETDSNHVYATTEIVVSGDLTGDGIMDANDIKNWRIGLLDGSLEGAFKMAADYDKDGNQSANDMKNMRTDILASLK